MKEIAKHILKHRHAKTYFFIASIFVFLIFFLAFDLDRKAESHIGESIFNAGAIYAASRAINAGVSVIQSADIRILIASVSPGELLDPINDMTERFSDIISFALASLALQKILLIIVGHNSFNILFMIAGLSLLFCLFFYSRGIDLTLRVFLTVFLIRISLAIIILANVFVSGVFLEKQIEESQTEFESLNTKISELTGSLPGTTMNDSSIDSLLDLQVARQERQAKESNNIKNIEADILNSNKELELLQSQVKCSWIFRCPKTDAILEIEKQLQKLERTLDERQVIFELIAEELKSLDKELACEEKRKSGGTCSMGEWWSKTKASVDVRKKIDAFRKSAEYWFNSAIYLLVLVFLKSIIIPIAFWYFIYRIGKQIWRFDFGPAST